MADDKAFKQANKPASCTQPPWAAVIESDRRDEVLAQIKRESVVAYGYSMDECPKRKLCFTKKCIGRPLPWKSPTAKPYLEKLQKTHNITNDELFLSSCDVCPIAKTCKNPCAQINDFLSRDKSEEPELVYKESLDNFIPEDIGPDKMATILGKGLKVPWDILTKKRKDTIHKYVYEQKDFLTIAQELKFHDQSRARYEFYAGLTKLSKYAVMRNFIEQNINSGLLQPRQYAILNDVFFINKSITDAAYDHGITKQAIQQMISKLVKAHNLKWHTFVRKEGNKVIYQVPELFK